MTQNDILHFNAVFKVLSNEGLLDINEAIFSLLTVQDICILRLVCKQFCEYIDCQKFWLLRLKTINIQSVFECKISQGLNNGTYAIRQVKDTPLIKSIKNNQIGTLRF